MCSVFVSAVSQLHGNQEREGGVKGRERREDKGPHLDERKTKRENEAQRPESQGEKEEYSCFLPDGGHLLSGV